MERPAFTGTSEFLVLRSHIVRENNNMSETSDSKAVTEKRLQYSKVYMKPEVLFSTSCPSVVIVSTIVTMKFI